MAKSEIPRRVLGEKELGSQEVQVNCCSILLCISQNGLTLHARDRGDSKIRSTEIFPREAESFPQVHRHTVREKNATEGLRHSKCVELCRAKSKNTIRSTTIAAIRSNRFLAQRFFYTYTAWSVIVPDPDWRALLPAAFTA